MWDACLWTADSVEPALEDIHCVVEYFGEGAHGRLSATVGLSLSPDLAHDLGTEGASKFIFGLLVEDVGQFFFGEEGFFVAVVALEHVKDAGEVVGFFVHRYRVN